MKCADSLLKAEQKAESELREAKLDKMCSVLVRAFREWERNSK